MSPPTQCSWCKEPVGVPEVVWWQGVPDRSGDVERLVDLCGECHKVCSAMVSVDCESQAAVGSTEP